MPEVGGTEVGMGPNMGVKLVSRVVYSSSPSTLSVPAILNLSTLIKASNVVDAVKTQHFAHYEAQDEKER